MKKTRETLSLQIGPNNEFYFKDVNTKANFELNSVFSELNRGIVEKKIQKGLILNDKKTGSTKYVFHLNDDKKTHVITILVSGHKKEYIPEDIILELESLSSHAVKIGYINAALTALKVTAGIGGSLVFAGTFIAADMAEFYHISFSESLERLLADLAENIGKII